MTHELARRTLLGGLALPSLGLAQPRFPDKPVSLICPFPPGGTTDVTMRVLAEAAAEARQLIWEFSTADLGTLESRSAAAPLRRH